MVGGRWWLVSLPQRKKTKGKHKIEEEEEEEEQREAGGSECVRQVAKESARIDGRQW